MVRLAPTDTASRSARLGIGILHPARLGQGLGSEATRPALACGFDQLDLHRVSLTVLADNARVVAAYTRCGFVVEGRFRHGLFRDCAWHDDLSMAIRKPQWEAQQAVAQVLVAGEPLTAVERELRCPLDRSGLATQQRPPAIKRTDRAKPGADHSWPATIAAA